MAPGNVLRASPAWRSLVVFLMVATVSACISVPRHDYPSDYPPAEPVGDPGPLAGPGPCPDLNGTFENAGTRLVTPPTSNTPISLTDLVFGPALIPPGAQVTTVRIRQAEKAALEITALSPDTTVAVERIAGVPHIHDRKPLTQYACRANHLEMQTQALTTAGVPALGAYSQQAGLMFYRAKDGSLIVVHEASTVGVVVLPILHVTHEWFRFKQVAE